MRLPVQSFTRWRGAELKRIDPKAAQQIRDLLMEARGFTSLFLRNDPSPWCGANLPDGKSVQQALDLVSHLSAETWPRFLEALNSILSQTQLRRPFVKAARTLAHLISGVLESLASYQPDIYKEDLGGLLTCLHPGKQGGISAGWALCTN